MRAEEGLKNEGWVEGQAFKGFVTKAFRGKKRATRRRFSAPELPSYGDRLANGQPENKINSKGCRELASCQGEKCETRSISGAVSPGLPEAKYN